MRRVNGKILAHIPQGTLFDLLSFDYRFDQAVRKVGFAIIPEGFGFLNSLRTSYVQRTPCHTGIKNIIGRLHSCLPATISYSRNA